MALRLVAGAYPSSYDGRDLEYGFPSALMVAPRARLPHKVPIRDQGELPCCLSMAVISCMEIIDGAKGGVIELAPLYHYYYARPEPAHLVSLTPRRALQTAAARGVCQRTLHDVAYDVSGAQTEPTREAWEDAATHRLVGFDPGTKTTPLAACTVVGRDNGRSMKREAELSDVETRRQRDAWFAVQDDRLACAPLGTGRSQAAHAGAGKSGERWLALGEVVINGRELRARLDDASTSQMTEHANAHRTSR